MVKSYWRLCPKCHLRECKTTSPQCRSCGGRQAARKRLEKRRANPMTDHGTFDADDPALLKQKMCPRSSCFMCWHWPARVLAAHVYRVARLLALISASILTVALCADRMQRG